MNMERAFGMAGSGLILCTLAPMELPSWYRTVWLPDSAVCQGCHRPLAEHLAGGARCVEREGKFEARVEELHTAITATHRRMGDDYFPLDVDRAAVARATAFRSVGSP